jgi:HK97 family phage major capsid protein
MPEWRECDHDSERNIAMSDVAKKLRDRRLNVWNEARGIVEGAAESNREMSPEEQGSWERMMEEIDKIDERITGVLTAEKRAKAAEDAFEDIGKRPATPGVPVRATPDGKDANAEIRAFLRGETGAPRSYMVSPTQGNVEQRVLVSNAAPGTAVVPTDFYDQLVAHLIEVSGVLQANPTVLRTAGGENLQIPKTTVHSTAASAAQNAAIPSSDPTLAMATLGAFKYGILLQVARELLDDSGVDLMGYLAMQAGRALGNKFGADLVTGVGTSQPTGFMTSTTIGVTGTTTGKTGAAQYADLVDLEYSVIAPYRASRSCYWIAADKTIGGFRKILDSQNRPIWEPSMQIGAPDLLLGKPLVADPYMPVVAVGAQSVAFGDFSQFFVRYVGGIRFERSDDYAFNTDLVTFRAILRGDGVLVDQTGAIKTYKGPAT